jgi:hypothetical protein
VEPIKKMIWLHLSKKNLPKLLSGDSDYRTVPAIDSDVGTGKLMGIHAGL